MKYHLLIILLGFLFNFQLTVCQNDTINARYFNNLKASFLRDPNISDVKFIQEKILKGSSLIQSMYVKYKYDHQNRFLHIGQEFIYHLPSYQLAYHSNVDPQSKIMSDTTYYYNESGIILGFDIYNLKYDSVVDIKKGNDFMMGIVGNFYEKYPNTFSRIEFSCKGDTMIEEVVKCNNNLEFVPDGDVTYYNKNKQVIKIKHYKMGLELGLDDASKISHFIDKRDGQTYPTIQIGQQIWIARNLSFKPSDGNYWVYNNDLSNAAKFGLHYSWETAKNVCPDGWRLPDKNDYETLLKQFGSNSFKELIPSGSSGFLLLDAPVHYGLNFTPVEGGTCIWTNTEKDKNYAWAVGVDSKKRVINIYGTFKKNSGLSVRCVKE